MNLDAGLPHTDEDYAAFVQGNTHTYLPKFHHYGATPSGFHAGWNWAAFFFSFWWFLYRKMYMWAAISFLTLWLPYFNFVVMIGWAIAANFLYFKHVNEKISELKSYHGQSYVNYLRSFGGVNSWVPWVALIVCGGMLLLLLLGIFGFALLASA